MLPVQQDIDIDGDGVADVYNFYRERADASRLLVRKEVDLNWMGAWTSDVVRLTGAIEKEEMDDFDASRGRVDHYQGGKRVLSEVDTDYNGAFDLFKVYESGKVR